MGDIVATIQPQQYEQIAATPEKIMIIQGVAGSGKSEVGIHRIAYLLSPHNGLGLDITPEKIIFIGPSRFFLRYIEGVLPGLNIRSVRQTTIQEWITSKLSHPIRLRQRDWLFERLLTLTKSNLSIDLKVTRFKNSIEMAKLLSRYIGKLLDKVLQKTTDIRISNRIVLKGSVLRTYIRANRLAPLNDLKIQVIHYISNQVSNKIESSNSITQDIEEYVDKIWPTFDFQQAYVELITSSSSLVELSKGALTKEEAEHFAIEASSDSYTCDTSDLAALSYLDGLFNRIPKSGFRHVVVDEGQDVTPLEYFLLSKNSSNQSFTILGDLAQSVIPHRGIMSWAEISRLFPKERIQRMNVNISYRSTNELTVFQNKILGRMQYGGPRAIPIGRHGEEPQFIRSKTYEDMLIAILNDIKSLQSKGVKSIAVLCKTKRESQRLVEQLKERGINLMRLDEDSETDSNVFVASAHQVKGLEFDAVLLCNARDYNYPDTWTNNRLLYLAVTRAAKYLHIHWFGNLATVLVPTKIPKEQESMYYSSSKQTRKENGVDRTNGKQNTPIDRGNIPWFRRIFS